MNGKRPVAFVAVFLVASSIVALGLPSAAAQDGGKPRKGEMAPPFSVKTLENRRVAIEDYQGEVLILEFFSSWCHICKDTTPELRQVRENFSPKNLAILSVESNSQVPIENVRDFKSEYGGDWSFAKAPSVADKYGVAGWPTTFVIGPKGIVRARFLGTVSSGVLAENVGAVLQTLEPSDNQPQDNQISLYPLSLVDFEVIPENGGGLVALDINVKQEGNTFLTFRVSPNCGYKFKKWKGQAVPENQREDLTLMLPLKPKTEITATFTPVENKKREENRPSLSENVGLSMRVRPRGSGKIVARDFRVVGGEPVLAYRADPNEGYRFQKWTGGEDLKGQRHDPTLEISPARKVRLTANFKRLKQSLTDRVSEVLFSVRFLLGAAIAVCLGLGGGYLVGCKRAG